MECFIDARIKSSLLFDYMRHQIMHIIPLIDILLKRDEQLNGQSVCIDYECVITMVFWNPNYKPSRKLRTYCERNIQQFRRKFIDVLPPCRQSRPLQCVNSPSQRTPLWTHVLKPRHWQYGTTLAAGFLYGHAQNTFTIRLCICIITRRQYTRRTSAFIGDPQLKKGQRVNDGACTSTHGHWSWSWAFLHNFI